MLACSTRVGDDGAAPRNEQQSTLDLPPGRLAYVGFVPDITGARHLTLHLADASGANARGVDAQLNGGDGIVSVVPGTQQVIYAACPSPRTPTSCRARIYDTATSEKRDITTAHPAVSVSPSPDGERIAYASGTALYVADIDGANERLLLEHSSAATIFSVAWSPSGDKIAFVAAVRGLAPVIGLDVRDVYVAGADGGVPSQLGAIGNACDPLNDPLSTRCSSPVGRGASVDQLLWFSDGERLLVSGRQFDDLGHRKGLAGIIRADGSEALDTGLSTICELGNSPAICGLTHLLDNDALVLVRVGGREMQLVKLKGIEILQRYTFGDISGIQSAVWLEPS